MDGFKDNDKTACAAVLNKTITKKTLPMESSNFIAEAHAIDLAQDIISKNKDKTLIFSDSQSVLLSLSNKKLENPQLLNCWVDSTLCEIVKKSLYVRSQSTLEWEEM